MQSTTLMRRVRWLAAAALACLLCLCMAVSAHAAEAVAIDCVTTTDFTWEGAKAPDQNGYLYYEAGQNGWIEFALPEIEPGEYTLSVVYKTHDNNGVFQAYLDGAPVGEPLDHHGSNSGDLTKELGTVTIAEGDAHAIRLVAQENEYEKYRIVVKSLVLTPVGEEDDDPVAPPEEEDPVTPPEIDFGETVVSESGHVQAWPMPYVYTASSDFTLTADGVDVPVIHHKDWYDYANFSMMGPDQGGDSVTVEITYKEPITEYSISPRKLGMTGTVDGNKLTLTLPRDEYLIIQINGADRRLALLADPWETDVPASSGDGIFNVIDYGADRTGTNLATEQIQQAIDDASAYGTEHGTRGVVYVPIGVYQVSSLALKSNVGLYLEGGAVLRLTTNTSQYQKRANKDSIGKPVLHMLYTYNNTAGDPYDGDDAWYQQTYQNPDNWVESTNIKIYGRGTVDGRGEEVDRLGWLSETLVPQNCSNLISDGIVYLDSGVWSINVVDSNDLTFTNLKVLNNILHENDCIDICNSQNVVVRNAFGSALDDPFSTKTFQPGEMFQSACGEPESLSNVLFEDCIAWTCCYGFKVGQGSVYTQDGVTFRDGVVYDCSVGLGIEHKYGDAELKNITFENIDIERVSNSNGALKNWLAFQCVSGSAEGTQPISNVAVRNIQVYDTGTEESRIVGYDQDSLITGLKFENIYMDSLGRNAASLEDMKISSRYLYATDISIDGQAVPDAPAPVTYLFLDVKDQAESNGAAMGEGDGYVYYGAQIGDWISFPIQVEEPGTYELNVIMKHHEKKGIFQTYFNGETVGEPVDQYGSNQDKVSVYIGTVTVNQAGEQNVRFEITGKNEQSGGYQLVLNGVSLTLVQAHEHRFSETWQTNETDHWRECACGETTDRGAHIPGDWIIDTEATETTPGSRHQVCKICGYTMATETLPVVTPHPDPTPENPNAQPSDKPGEENPAQNPHKPANGGTQQSTSQNVPAAAEKASPTTPAASAVPADSGSIPQTGDSLPLALLVVLLTASAAGLLAVTFYLRAKSK